MKKIMLLFISVITVIITMFAVADVAFANTSQVKNSDIKWTDGVTGGAIYFDAGTGKITGCDSKVENAKIPESINGTKVTKIGRYAFFRCTSLTEITLPDTVTCIEYGAFEKCTSLEKITIPNSVTKMEELVFDNCTLLAEVTIPDGVKDLGTFTFYGCTSLKKIEIPNSVTSLGSSVFEKCTSLEKIIIPNSVTRIGDRAFSGCTSLEEIVIPNSVTRIATAAFIGCTSLEEITIPNSVTSIEVSAFSKCEQLQKINVDSGNLNYKSVDGVVYDKSVVELIFWPNGKTEIIIPDSVTSIATAAFIGCTSLKKIEIPNNVTSLGKSAFSGCTSLEEIVIPNSVTSLGDWAFYGCTSLKKIEIPNSVTSLGSSVFEKCTSLEKITIPNSVTSIAAAAFIGCTSLKKIEIPNSVTCIEYQAFEECTSLEKITIPNSVTSLGTWAFSGCTSLEEIVIPKGVTSLEGTFRGCTSLREITIPNSVTRIGSRAFEKCTSLEKITIPNSVTSIGMWAFSGCTSLEEIVIPNNVTSIGEWAFENCTSLGEMVISNSVTNIEYAAFIGCISLEKITIPNSVTLINHVAFYGCTSLKEIIIPNSVTSIGNSAFGECDSLRYIIGYKSSYAEEYAKTHGYTFKTIGDHLSAIVEKNQYGIFVYDSEGIPIPNASVTFGENAPVLTDENGLALCPKQTFGIPKLLVSCEGYITYTNSGENYQKNKDRYDIVVLSKDDEAGLKLNSAVYYNTSDEVKYTVDVLRYTKKLTLTLDDDITNIFTEYQGDVKFRLECEAVDKNAVVRYELWQNNKKMAESKDGKFILMAKPFSSGKPIQVKTFNARGRSASKTINLVITKTEPVKHTFEFGSKLKFKIGDSVPILGGQEVDIDLNKNIPIEFKISEDSIYLGFNIKNFDKKSEEEIKKEKEAIKELRKLEFSKANAKKFEDAFKKFAKSETKGKIDVNLIGYAEGKWKMKEGRFQEVKLKAYLAVKVDASVSTGWNWVVVVVPITVQIDLGMEVVLAAEAEITFPEFSSSADLTATLKPYLEIYLGAGVGKLISAGGYAKGEIESEIVILGCNEPSGIKSVDATIEAGVKAYLGFKEWEYRLASKTYNLYTRTNSPQMLTMHALEDSAFERDMYNATNYSLQDVSYLEDESEWLGLYRPMMLRAARNGQEGIQIYDLVTTTYENAQPSVASNQEKMVMAYLRGDTSRSVYNMTQVMYSVYDAQTGTWKEPKALDEMDITGDYAPRLYSDGTDIYLVYQDCNTTFDEESGADMGNFAKAQVIKIARFDNDTETFVDITSLSEESLENDCYNTDAVFGIVVGTPTVTWISNPDPSDVFRQNNTNAIQCSKFENGQWQKAETLVSNEGCITEVAVGDDGIAYVMDTDNQLNTADDRVLKLVQNNGVVSVAEGKVYGLSYTQLPGSKNKKLTWMSKDGLKKYEGEALNIADNLTVASGYQVIDNDIYYVMSEGNQANLYKRVYDVNTQTWADPVQLTESERYVEALTVTKFGDDVFATLLNTDLTTEGEAVNRNCNLGWTKLNEVTDLAIISAEYESEQVKPGAELPIQIKIKNNGTTKIEKVNVTITDTDGTAVYSNAQDVLLASGEEGFIEAQLTMPETIAQANYTVTVTTEKADKNFSDNETTFTVGYTDLSVDYEQAQIGDKQFLYMTVTNESYVPSGGKLEVKCGEEVTFETEIEELINGESTTVAVGLSDIMLSNGSSGTISVNVTADKEETSLYNNQELVYMDMDYQISYFANIKNNEEAFYEAVKVYDEALAVTEACPTRKGYRLIGWSTDKKASEPEYRIGDSIVTNQTLTLYGVWEENTGKSGILYGDVDENFKIDATDVLWIERYLAAWEPYAGLNKETADLNEDGMIDLKDVTILERYLAKWKGYGVLPLAI